MCGMIDWGASPISAACLLVRTRSAKTLTLPPDWRLHNSRLTHSSSAWLWLLIYYHYYWSFFVIWTGHYCPPTCMLSFQKKGETSSSIPPPRYFYCYCHWLVNHRYIETHILIVRLTNSSSTKLHFIIIIIIRYIYIYITTTIQFFYTAAIYTM